jgi:hypothetical protein
MKSVFADNPTYIAFKKQDKALRKFLKENDTTLKVEQQRETKSPVVERFLAIKKSWFLEKGLLRGDKVTTAGGPTEALTIDGPSPAPPATVARPLIQRGRSRSPTRRTFGED